MQTYIGTKVIRAERMDRLSFHRDIRPFVAWDSSGPNEEGYKVVYSDGYVSWSPQGVFEVSYRAVTPAERTLLS